MSRRLVKRLNAAAILASAALVQPVFAGNTWTGGSGTSSNWSDNANWGGAQPGYGTLTFSGSTRTTNSDDNITAMNQLLWTGSSAWTLNQGGTTVLQLFDNGGTQAKVENQSTGLVTINLPITFHANNGSPPFPFGEINAVNGDLTFGTGTLTVDGPSVNGIKMFGSGHTVTYNSTISAGTKWFGFTTGGAGNTAVINGTVTSGDWYVMNNGTLNISGTANVNGAGVFRLGGDFGNTGNQDQTKAGTLQLTSTTGGQTLTNIINSVTGNTSGALVVNSLATSGTNTLSGNIFLDSNLKMSQSSGGTLNISATTVDVKAQTLSLVGSGGSINVSGVISNSVGAGQLVVGTNGTAASGGTVTLSNTDTYNGDTFIRNGALAFTSSGSLSNSTMRLGSTSGAGVDAAINLTTLTGGTTLVDTLNPVATSGSGNLTFNSQNTSGTNAFTGHIGLDRNFTITQAAGGTLNITQARSGVTTNTGFDIKGFTVTFTPNGTINDSGDIYNPTNAGTVTMNGTGTLVLSGTNTYSGATNDNSGTIVFSNLGNLGSGAAINFGGGTLQYASGNSADISTRTVTLNAGGGTIDTNGNNASYANSIGNGGSGGLTKVGAGTLTLNALSSYTGNTNINGGTLAVANLGTLGNGSVTVNNGGTLDIGAGNPLILNVNGTYTQNTGGTLTLQINDTPTPNHSILQSMNAANLGGTLNMNVGGGGPAATGTYFTVINTSSRNGTFGAYTTNIGAGKAFDTSRVENHGQLAVINYFNGFENVNGTWANNAATFNNSVNSYVFGGPITPGNATQIVDSANASSNSAYGKLTTTAEPISIGGPFPATANVGPLTRFNGNSATFGSGYTTQVDVYIDPAWAGTANGTGFDFSSAISDQSGNFLRDFIFHVFKDTGGTMYLAANNNSDYKPDPSYASIVNKLAITTPGWYTLQNTFHAMGSGVLTCDMSVYDSSGNLLFVENRVSPLDVVATQVGGNNYGWFVNIDTGSGANNFLKADNVKLLNAPVSGPAGPVTNGTTYYGPATLDGATVDLGGTSQAAVTNGYDYIDITNGTATLTGNLAIDFVNGFENSVTSGDQFIVLQADQIAGGFANITDGQRVNTADGSGSFLANFQTVNGTTELVLSDFSAAVPEPSTLGLTALAGIALLRRRRR
jgi:autotransporter-associated beta strand protein